MRNLGDLRQAGTTYTFEVDENKNLFVNQQPAELVVRRGIQMVTFGDTTIENIGVFKFRFEKAGVEPKQTASKPTVISTPVYRDCINAIGEIPWDER